MRVYQQIAMLRCMYAYYKQIGYGRERRGRHYTFENQSSHLSTEAELKGSELSMMKIINPKWNQQSLLNEKADMAIIKKRKTERKVQYLIIEAYMKKQHCL